MGLNVSPPIWQTYIFSPELQKLLKPIYDLMRKGKQFVWGIEQQNAFDEIKQRLQKTSSFAYA